MYKSCRNFYTHQRMHVRIVHIFAIRLYQIYHISILYLLEENYLYQEPGNDSNLLIVFYVQIMPDDFVMQLHRF
ncbi:beta-galactosidase [Escherichia coli]|nr:hypothetical protein DJICPGNB_08645 [Escherichia coli]SQO37822.1 beta-galactosidase [Escherichia coli]